MVADSNSNIAWHRVQLKKNREALKALETARFTIGEIATSKRDGQTQKMIAELQHKIGESERCIAEHEKRTRRPLTTDLKSLASASWGNWNSHAPHQQRKSGQRSSGRG